MARGDDGSGSKRRKTNNDTKKRPAPPPRDVVPMELVLASNAALRDVVASLGATRPSYVTAKHLKTSDVHPNQARLLFSCKSGPLATCPLAGCFTEREARHVVGTCGLLVTALDRGGRSYDLTCKYLASNHAYRFISGWKAFLEANGLLLDDDHGSFRRDVHVELWAFRSRALPNRFVDGEEDKKEKKKIYEETGHPDGALGLVLLHYENAVERAAGDEAGMAVVDEEPMMPAAAPPPVTRQEAAAAWAMSMTKDEMVAKFGEKMANAAIGMSMLRRDSWARDCMDPGP